MNPILLGALGGAAGAGLGGLLGLGFDRATGRGSQAPLILAVALAVGGAQLGALSGPKAPTVEADLEAAGPVYKVIHRYYPDVFAQMAADARSVDPKDNIALQNKIRPRLSALVGAHRAQMDDTSVNALGKLMLDETQLLQGPSPQSCVAILGGGGKTTVDMGAVFTPQMVHADAEVTAGIIEQVATRPATPPPKLTDEETRALVGQAMAQLSTDEQKAVAPLLQQQPRTPATAEEARAFCAFYRSLFTAALRGPDQTLRRFLAN